MESFTGTVSCSAREVFHPRLEHRPGLAVCFAVETQQSTPTQVPVQFHSGDILRANTAVMVSTANPGFQLTGGIGAALMSSGGARFQAELNALARSKFGTKPAARGSFVVSTGANLPFSAIIHVVAIDVFYKTTDDVLTQCMVDSLLEANQLGASSVAIPAFATGYGRHPLVSCGAAMKRGYLIAQSQLNVVGRVELWMRDDHRLAEFTRGWCL